MSERLEDIAAKMVADGKGILAADESSGTIKKRFDAIGVDITEDNRRDYREMLFRADDAMKTYISGVILYDETLAPEGQGRHAAGRRHQRRRRGSRHQGRYRRQAARRLPRARRSPRASTACASASRNITALGARFAKWRGVIAIADGLPSWGCDQGQRAGARPLRRALPGSRHRADRRAGSADGRRSPATTTSTAATRSPTGCCRPCSTSSTTPASASKAWC